MIRVIFRLICKQQVDENRQLTLQTPINGSVSHTSDVFTLRSMEQKSLLSLIGIF